MLRPTDESADVRAFIDYPYVGAYMDVDNDGNAELLSAGYGFASLVRADGITIWKFEAGENEVPAFWRSTVLYFDVDGDSVSEFIVAAPDGVHVLRGDGTTLAHLGTCPYDDVRPAQLDDDPEFEIVALCYDTLPNPGRYIEIWELNGTLLGAIRATKHEFRAGQ